MSVARLLTTRAPRHPRGVVVVLHGGAARSGDIGVSLTQLSVVRMVPVAARIALAGRGRLAVHRLLNTHRGWDSRHTPLVDVRWALAQLRERYDDAPVCLVGHSLGGRAALLSADQPGVRSVVALNPWVQPTDAVDLSGRSALVVHGLADRVAPAGRSEALARRVVKTGRLAYVGVPDGDHAMLRHGLRFEQYAADFAISTLLGTPSRIDAIREALAGDGFVFG